MIKDTPSIIHSGAIELIREYGYTNVSVNQICKKANITKGTFYYHFFSKDQLLINLFHKEMASTLEYNNQNISTLEMINHNIEVVFNKIENIGYEITSEVLSIELKHGGLVNNIFDKDNFLVDRHILIVSLIKKAQSNGDISPYLNAEEFYHSYCMGSLGILFEWCLKKGSYRLSSKVTKLFQNIFLSGSMHQNTTKV